LNSDSRYRLISKSNGSGRRRAGCSGMTG
jgi:hypothetical protein